MTRVLSLALVTCLAMFAVSHVRPVLAEDDCAMGTFAVQRLPDFVGGDLVCIFEPQTPFIDGGRP
jgi:hypothetical protein